MNETPEIFWTVQKSIIYKVTCAFVRVYRIEKDVLYCEGEHSNRFCIHANFTTIVEVVNGFPLKDYYALYHTGREAILIYMVENYEINIY